MSKKITIIIGTRPEAIKLSPVIIKFKSCEYFDVRVILTGQHNEMVYQVLNLFNIKPDYDLKLMRIGQSLSHITCEVIKGIEEELLRFPSDLLLVQGDTSTAFAASLAAFHNKVPVGHIEAGLRTNNIFDPFPEEANRRLISQICSIHFAPTKEARNNLIQSGIKENIFVTGNTVIDSLLMVSDNVENFTINGSELKNYKVIFTTVHRRENWGKPLRNICSGIKKIVNERNDVCFILPMHKNNKVRDPIIELLGNNKQIILTEPIDYKQLVSALKLSTIVLTDSGGLQEEAPALGKPVLVLRQTTERPEAVSAGTSKLIGTQSNDIYNNVKLLLDDKDEYEKMAKAINPFGDGNASTKILRICLDLFSDN